MIRAVGLALIFVISAVGCGAPALSRTLLWPNTPAIAGDFRGLMYGPFRDGEDPRLGIFPTYDELAEDVNILASVTDLIGMYSTDHGFSDVIALGGAGGLRVIPGCFLDNGSNDDAEVNSLIDTLNLYPDSSNIPFAMVGSEAVSLQGVAVGDLLLIRPGAKVPVDAQGRVIGDDARTQAGQVFRNLQIALAEAGASFAHIVKLTIYLVRADDFAAVRDVRSVFLGLGTAPVSTLVVVAALARPEFLLEVEAIAVAP